MSTTPFVAERVIPSTVLPPEQAMVTTPPPPSPSYSAGPIQASTADAVLLQGIARLLENPNIPMDRIKVLLELHEKATKDRARLAFIAAMAKFKENAPQINKDKHVKIKAKDGGAGPEYDHATLGEVCDKIIRLLGLVGVSHSWEPEQLQEGWIQVTCILEHVGGHTTRTMLKGQADNSGTKNPLQALNSAGTYLCRYTLLMAVGMATLDDDDGRGGADNQPSGEPEQRRIPALPPDPVRAIDLLPANEVTDMVLALKEAPNLAKLDELFIRACGRAEGDHNDPEASQRYTDAKNVRKAYLEHQAKLAKPARR